MIEHTDTIAAISTPKGTGALAVIRMSGPHSLPIINSVFEPFKSNALVHRQATFGRIVDFDHSDSVLDQVVVTYYRAPHSFTGQDLVETSCHGGVYVVNQILQLLLNKGARLAGPGEFSIRAFMNGKLDLVQAEAIVDVINAQTQTALQVSQQQLDGNLSQHFDSIKKNISKQLSLLELELDFSEEDIEFSNRQSLQLSLQQILDKTVSLLDTFEYGHIIREGAHIVLAGPPNVGKSSILNRFLDKDRAIVSDIPGTTRDSLEESLNIKGYLFKISDTAGLRESDDSIEQQGVERTRGLMQQADIILYIIDITDPQEMNYNEMDPKTLIVFNKSDINKKTNKYPENIIVPHVLISAKTGQGFDKLEKMIVDKVFANAPAETEQIVTRVRHRNALYKTKEHIEHAIRSLEQSLSPEFIALDIRSALDYIGEITGQVTTDDILNDIFDKFCIGK